jgi:integrase
MEGIAYRYRTGIAWRDLPEVLDRGRRCEHGIAGQRWTEPGSECSRRSRGGKVVQERRGHSNISTTMNIYSHVTPTMQRDAVSRLANLLGGGE